MSQPLAIIIAGSTGLVGQSTVEIALDNDNISQVYSLSRHPIEIEHNKLIQWLDPELNLPAINTISPSPTVGVIALGTTLKKAGSKAKLRAIDVELVSKVAKDMRAIGVQHIIVVSCLGASTKATSHYLRCKGEMEKVLQNIDFITITFMQPGPLSGPRKERRIDEKLLQLVMSAIKPLLMGSLANYKPIESIDVARAIVHEATKQNTTKDKQVTRINTSQMITIIS